MEILKYANTIWVKTEPLYKKGEGGSTYLHAAGSTWVLATEYFGFLEAEEVWCSDDNTLNFKVNILSRSAYRELCSKNVDVNILLTMDCETCTPKLIVGLSFN